MKKYNLIFFVLVTVAALILYSCERPTEPANQNLPPNTSMANIPNTSDTLFALVTLHWDGEDFDGYIDGFEYRYITRRIFIGDTVVHDWEFTKETSLTIPFQSDDDLNQQIFQVRSVDNLGAVDPEPAEKVFYTVKTIFPESHILYPENEETYFIIDEPTDWWEGIRLDFVAYDRDGEVVEYAWSVDDGELHWTEDTTVVIKPEEFKVPLTGEHTIKVVSRDNTNLIDPVGNTVRINLVRPSLEKRILIIDATNEANFPAGLVNKANDAKVDTFYSTVYEGSDQWDFIKNGMPPVEVLGQYRLVVWHSDDLPFTQPHQISRYTEQIKDYMNVGGNIIIGGWRILKSFAWLDNFPKTFEPGTFVNDYLHIVSVDETSLIGDFTGGAGLEGVYSNIRVDSAKAAGFPYSGMLGNINMILLPAGFTDGIYFYQNKNNSPYFEYRGRTVGLRYYGTTFQSVVLGFPMYFIREDDAKQMINEILAQMGI